MTEQKNTPAIIAAKTAVALTEQRSSLVARGLAAILPIRQQEGNDAVAADDKKLTAARAALTAYEGNAKDQYNRGLMYYNGGDYEEAVKWYLLAAEQGHVEAQYDLGCWYAIGRGVPQDYKEAMRWYRLAAEQGHVEAQYNLGYRYYHGRCVPQDYKEAVKWYRLAAEQGHVEAQYNLGVMHDLGLVVPQDYKEASKWYREAADQGDAKAQFHLGRMYRDGCGVESNDFQAIYWFIKAAKSGHSCAQGTFEKLGIDWKK